MGCRFFLQKIFLTQGVKPTSPALAGRSFTPELPGNLPHLVSQPPNPSVNHHFFSTTSPMFTLGHHLDVQPLWHLLTFVISAVTGSTTLSSSSPRPSPSLALAFKLLETYSFKPCLFLPALSHPPEMIQLCDFWAPTPRPLCSLKEMTQWYKLAWQQPHYLHPQLTLCGPWQSFPLPSLSDSPSAAVALHLLPVSSSPSLSFRLLCLKITSLPIH